MTPPSQQPPAAGHPDPGRLMRFATYASVTAAAVLIAAKLVAWSLTGSVAVLSTLVDSLLDLLASLVPLFDVRRSEARRGGKECGSQCRSRCAPYHYTTKKATSYQEHTR